MSPRIPADLLERDVVLPGGVRDADLCATCFPEEQAGDACAHPPYQEARPAYTCDLCGEPLGREDNESEVLG